MLSLPRQPTAKDLVWSMTSLHVADFLEQQGKSGKELIRADVASSKSVLFTLSHHHIFPSHRQDGKSNRVLYLHPY